MRVRAAPPADVPPAMSRVSVPDPMPPDFIVEQPEQNRYRVGIGRCRVKPKIAENASLVVLGEPELSTGK